MSAGRQKRLWVREFWADQMRRENAPELPEGMEDERGIALFNDESRRLADWILSRGVPKK
jgi:hypothetical protein